MITSGLVSTSAFPGAVTAPDGSSRRRAALVAAAGAIATFFFLWLSPRSSLWDRDEALYARIACEMRSSGDVLVPTLDGRPWPYKPPLLMWLQAACLHLPVPLETAVRLPSALALATAVWFTFRAAEMLRPGVETTMAAAALLTSPLALLHGAAATTDALLLAASAAALAALAHVVREGPHGRHAVALAAAMTIGLLAKGPPGLVLPLLSAAPLFFVVPRESRGPLALLLLGAGAVSVVAFLAWAVPANEAMGGLLVSEGLRVDVLERMWRPLHGHGGWGPLGLLFFPAVLVLGVVPWTLFLPTGFQAIGTWRSAEAALLVASVAAPLSVFSLAATKLPNYILPALPALSIIAAAGVHGRRAPSAGGLVLYLAGAAPWIGCLGLAAAIAPSSALRLVATELTSAALLSAVLGIFLVRRGHPRAAAAALGGGVIVLATLFGATALPAAEPLRPVRAIAAAARKNGEVPVATFGFEEPSLDLYLHAGPRPIEKIPSDRAALAWTRGAGRGVLVTTAENAGRLGLAGAARVAVLHRADGWNVPTGRPIALVALERYPP